MTQQLIKVKSNFDEPNCEMCGLRLDGSCTIDELGGCCSKTRGVVFPMPMFAQYAKDVKAGYCFAQNLKLLERVFLGNLLIYRDIFFCEQSLPRTILISHIIVSYASISLCGYECKTTYTEKLQPSIKSATINEDIYQTLLRGEVYKDKKYLQYYKLINLDVSYDDFLEYANKLLKLNNQINTL